MKKTVFAMLVFTAFSAAAFAAAPDRAQKFDIGFTAGGFWPDNEDFSSAGYVGGNMSYGITQNFAAGFSIGYADSGLEVDPGNGVDISGGSVDVMPVFADIYFRWPNESQFVPYAVFGVGAVVPWAESDAMISRGLKAEKRVKVATKLGAGVDWFATKNWIVNLEGHYVWTDSGFDIVNNLGNRVDSAQLDYFYFGAGAKYLYE